MRGLTPPPLTVRSRLGSLAHKFLDVHEGGALLEVLARQVVDVLATGREAQVQALQVGGDVELLFVVGTVRLHAQIEGSQIAELHLLALQELLQQTVGQLDGDALADILTVDGVVLGHVLDEFTIGHRAGGDGLAVILAVAGRHLLVVVLSDFD